MYSVILHSSWVLLFWAIPWVCRDCFSLYYFWSTDPWPSLACKHSIGCPLYLFFAKPPFPSTHLSCTWSVLRLHGGIGPLAPVVAWTVKEEAAVSLKQNKTKQNRSSYVCVFSPVHTAPPHGSRDFAFGKHLLPACQVPGAVLASGFQLE